jgi:hypothetical protein
MSDQIQPDTFSRFQSEPPSLPTREIVGTCSPFPAWLARRLLGPDEKVTWVRGPKRNPSWERYITHPGLLLVPVAVAAIVALVGGLTAGAKAGELLCPFFGICFVAALPMLFVVGIACGYFTRLVVTNQRVVVLQGYEICDTWDVARLPRSLVRQEQRDGQPAVSSVDLNALNTILGGSSTQFVEAKTILDFAKTLKRLSLEENDGTDADKTAPQG